MILAFLLALSYSETYTTFGTHKVTINGEKTLSFSLPSESETFVVVAFSDAESFKDGYSPLSRTYKNPTSITVSSSSTRELCFTIFRVKDKCKFLSAIIDGSTDRPYLLGKNDLVDNKHQCMLFHSRTPVKFYPYKSRESGNEYLYVELYEADMLHYVKNVEYKYTTEPMTSCIVKCLNTQLQSNILRKFEHHHSYLPLKQIHQQLIKALILASEQFKAYPIQDT